MDKGLDEQHSAHTLVCGGGFQVLKLLGEASDPAEPSLQLKSAGQRVKNLLCLRSHLHLGDEGHPQRWSAHGQFSAGSPGATSFPEPEVQMSLCVIAALSL